MTLWDRSNGGLWVPPLNASRSTFASKGTFSNLPYAEPTTIKDLELIGKLFDPLADGAARLMREEMRKADDANVAAMIRSAPLSERARPTPWNVGVDMGFGPDFTAAFHVVIDKRLDPKLERERSRDGSCVNLTRVARNKKRLEDASRFYVLKGERLIVCPTHMFEALKKELGDGRTSLPAKEGL